MRKQQVSVTKPAPATSAAATAAAQKKAADKAKAASQQSQWGLPAAAVVAGRAAAVGSELYKGLRDKVSGTREPEAYVPASSQKLANAAAAKTRKMVKTFSPSTKGVSFAQGAPKKSGFTIGTMAKAFTKKRKR